MKYKKCNHCGETKLVSEFAKNKTRCDGLHSKCKLCHAEYNKTHYLKNKEPYLRRARATKERNRHWLRDYKDKLKCTCCPEDHASCLEFHHKDQKEKDYGIPYMIRCGFSLEKIIKEIEKCTVLCSNCHKKLHWEEKEGV